MRASVAEGLIEARQCLYFGSEITHIRSDGKRRKIGQREGGREEEAELHGERWGDGMCVESDFGKGEEARWLIDMLEV